MINISNYKILAISKKLIIAATALVLSTQVLAYDFSDEMPYSTQPPAGLSPNNVPMFVSIGFDDNGDSEGMEWIIDFLKDRNNQDGTPARVTFFNTTKYINYEEGRVKESWKKAENDGHEIGNHSVNHLMDENHDSIDASGWDAPTWYSEIFDAQEDLKTNHVEENIIGFRTPRLEVTDNTLTALEWMDMTYDASIYHAVTSDGRHHPWPYTLDGGSSSNSSITSHPGLWELPVTSVIDFTTNTEITGFDYNMWINTEGNINTKDRSLKILKDTLDRRLDQGGNRAPMLFGAHTAFYSSEYINEAMNLNPSIRRRVIEEFIDYALSKQDVRIVPYKAVIDWMRNPVTLSEDTSSSNTIAKKVQDFGELIERDYASHLFLNGDSYAKAEIVKNILNAANDISRERNEDAMKKLWTALWYVDEKMNDTIAQYNARNNIKSYISQIGY